MSESRESLLAAAQRHLEASTYLLLDQPSPIIIPLEERAAAAQANAITAAVYLLLAKERARPEGES